MAHKAAGGGSGAESAGTSSDSEGAASPALSYRGRPARHPSPPSAISLLEANVFHAVLGSVFANSPLRPELWQFLPEGARTDLQELLKKKFVFEPAALSFRLGSQRRRSEEECKFVVKKGMRFLFKQFKRRNKGFIKGSKVCDETEFYAFYFGAASARSGEAIDNFYLPGSKLQRLSPDVERMSKTVSYGYIQKIFTAEAFRADFVAYLLNEFCAECVAARAPKLEKLADALATGRRRKGIKLPWSDLEIQLAQTHLISIITNVL